MKREIRITKKKGEDGHKIVSVRMREDTLKKLDELAEQTNRSRNELINLLLAEALQWWRKTDGFGRTQQRT